MEVQKSVLNSPKYKNARTFGLGAEVGERDPRRLGKKKFERRKGGVKVIPSEN